MPASLSESLQGLSAVRLASLPVESLMQSLPPFVASYIAPAGAAREEIARELDAVRERSGRAEWERLQSHMQTLGDTFDFYRRDPLATEINHSFMSSLLLPDSTLRGLAELDTAMDLRAAGRRVMIVGNHLSYADTIALCELLRRAGRRDVSERIAAVAGPKVYSDPMRRLAAAGIHSIKVAQSRRLTTNEIELSAREITQITHGALRQAEAAMDEGCVVLIYPEGTRSRSLHLQPFMRATGRWLSIRDVVLLPFGLWGLERLHGVSHAGMTPATCHGAFGPLLDTCILRERDGASRDELLSRAHASVAALLPEPYAPLPGTPSFT